jgi:hypothetical protein
MDAYVFGKHDGELPVHLVGSGEPGNRVRVVAAIDDSAYQILYAFEAPDQQVLDEQISTTQSNGTTPSTVMVPCADEDCVQQVKNIVERVSWLPPYPCLLFILVEAEGVLEVLTDLVEELGAKAVAAFTDGSGRFVVEVGGDDWEPLERAHARIAAAENVSATTPLRVSGSAFHRAP